MSKSKQSAGGKTPQKANPYAKKPAKKTPWARIAALCALAACLVLVFVLGILPKLTKEKTTWNIEIEVRDYGTIKAELYADIAPITVANFIKLARSGFYDGLTFHRVISGFMIQGGDPLGNGTGGSEETIKGEFAMNGVANPLKHTRGVLSMARSTAYNSASSQFFIMHGDASHLDGKYAAFGRVTEGMEIVDAICADTPVTDSNGTVARENQPVITRIRVVE